MTTNQQNREEKNVHVIAGDGCNQKIEDTGYIQNREENWEKDFDRLQISCCDGVLHDEGVSQHDFELKQFIRSTRQSAAQEAREEVITMIKGMKLWSKGTVEGTRNDIITKLNQLTTK